MAKHDLGKVRLKPMQSAVSPFTVCDLWGSPLEDLQGCCVTLHCTRYSASWSLRTICFVFLWIFADSRPFPSLPYGCWSLGKYGSGKLFPLIHSVWRCRLAAASGGGSCFQGCHGYLPFCLRLLLLANLSGTSGQAHLFVTSLTHNN